jgi:hypothetical protein
MTSNSANSVVRVRGWSALTWSRIVRLVTIIGSSVGVLSFVLGWIPGLRDSPWWTVPFLAGFGPALFVNVVSLAGVRNEKREVAAGYTTLRRSYPEVKQIDPRTGEVIREAGRRFLDGSSSALPPDAPGVRRPGIPQRIARGAVFGLGPFLASGALFALIRPIPGFSQTALAVVVLSVLVIYAIVIGLGALRMRGKLRRLRAAAPGEFAFTFGRSSDAELSIRALLAPGDPLATELSLSRGATASRTGLTFWGESDFRALAHLPWSRVISVQQAESRIGGQRFPGIVVSFHPEGSEQILALRLPNAEAENLTVHDAAEARWVAAELDALRTSGTTARLL